jgi:hypothetical protein
MKSITSILLLLVVINSFSQDVTRIFGYITDASSTQAISNAHVYFEGSGSGTVSDEKGYYSLNFSANNTSLIVSHTSYEKRIITISTVKTQRIDVELIFSETILPVVQITTPKPQKIISNESFFVQDYEFLDSNILVIGYHYGQNPGLLLLSPFGDTLAQSEIHETAEYLYKDCLDNVHLVTEKNAYQVFYDKPELKLIYPVSRKEFDKTLPRCIEELNGKFYFREYYYKNQVLLYFYKEADSTEKKLTLIADEKALRMLGDQERFISMGKEFTEADQRFEDMFFYDPVFCPLYKVNSQLYIINFVDSRIEKYNDSGKLLGTVGISFQNEKSWKEFMVVDEKKGNIYSVFRKNGITNLKELNLNTGETGRNIAIPRFPFIEKISAYNGYLYFLYSSLVTQDKKMLYWMKLD